jgi:hypothetical protein
MSQLHFSQMIERLRQHEEVLLYANHLSIAEADEKASVQFLKNEYERESVNFPHTLPKFDAGAAIWAANVIYLSSQLLLYREQRGEDIPSLFPAFPGAKNSGAMLSADLCLRFLPDLIEELQHIDVTDKLIGVLHEIIYQWPFSAILMKESFEKTDFTVLMADPCLHQLSADRITAKRKIHLAQLPEFKSLIASNLSIYKQDIWPEFMAEK